MKRVATAALKGTLVKHSNACEAESQYVPGVPLAFANLKVRCTLTVDRIVDNISAGGRLWLSRRARRRCGLTRSAPNENPDAEQDCAER